MAKYQYYFWHCLYAPIMLHLAHKYYEEYINYSTFRTSGYETYSGSPETYTEINVLTSFMYKILPLLQRLYMIEF